MAASRRPSVESLITAAAFATVGIVGGWAAGLWEAPAPVGAQPVEQAAPPLGTAGSAPEADARAGVPDVCSRRIGCLVR